MADSIGLGVFTANGAAICIAFGCGDRIFLTLVCAVLTGVGGGILRDLCCMERPYVFTKHIYACASLGGAAVCLLLGLFSNGILAVLGQNAAMLACLLVTIVLRLCAAHFRWSLPRLREGDQA